MKLSLKNRIILPVLLTGAAIMIAIIASQTKGTMKIVKAEAMEKTEQMAYHYANSIDGEFNGAMDAARTMAQIFETHKKSGSISRLLLGQILTDVLENNTKLLAAWTCWEPQALDGKDGEFVDKPGHDKTGRFVPYYNRATGKIALEPLVDYEKPVDGDYYLVAKNSGQETVVEPYWYEIAAANKRVFMTSLVVPIRFENKVVGVVGVDIDLSDVQQMVATVKPYETGWAVLLSNKGLYAAHYQAEKVGKNQIEDKDDPTFRQRLAQTISKGDPMQIGRFDSSREVEILSQYVPVVIGKTRSNWSFNVNIPMAKVMEKPLQAMYFSIALGAIGLLVLTVLVAVIANRISGPMLATAEALGNTSCQISSASAQVASASQSLAEGASEQAASLEETSSSLEEMSSMTKRNADSANRAKDLANTTKSAAEVGSQCVQSMSQSMDRIQGSSNELRQAMGAVKESNNEVAKIIKTIDEIAFQTNILALNAAVEAARAGDAGMGFAVVADEVRNLAQKSAAAARETAAKIEAAIGRTEAGVRVSEKVVDDLKAVLEQSRQVESSLKGIEQKSREVDGLVGEIATASAEQSQGIEQVNTAVSQMDKVTQSNAANAEESASAAEELNAQAENLKEAVNELLTMVDGNQSRKHATKPTVLLARSTKPHHSQSILSKGNGVSKQNHNGTQHGAEHAPQAAVNDRDSIPIKQDFKDF